MYSPPQISASQHGHGRDIEAVGGSSRHAKPIESTGASRTYGGIIHGKALGNAPNIGDFDLADPAPEFVDIDATVNIFSSNTHPTTIDVDETAIMAVVIPFEEDLASLLKGVAKYYSPLSGRHCHLYYILNPKFHNLFLENNEHIYILDPKKCKWIVKGRFREALEFQDSVLQFWNHTNSGPTLTIFLVNPFIFLTSNFCLHAIGK